MTPAPRAAGPEEEEAARIEAWLRAHPAFLAERPGLYAVLAPPQRFHGEVLADHMAAIIAAGRAEWRQVLDAGRARDAFAARIGEAVLALMQATDARDCLLHACPALLGLEHADLLPRRAEAPLLLRDVPQASADWHGAAAPLIRREALLDLGAETLVLGARDPAALPNAPESLRLLARAAAAALAR